MLSISLVTGPIFISLYGARDEIRLPVAAGAHRHPSVAADSNYFRYFIRLFLRIPIRAASCISVSRPFTIMNSNFENFWVR